MEHKKNFLFTDLIVWQESHRLVVTIYKTTKLFPREEIFGLSSQMRRAAVSITSNIAEGFARKNKKEKLQFYNVARSSLVELESQLYVARDVGYLDSKSFDGLYSKIVSAHKLLNAFINKTNDL